METGERLKGNEPGINTFPHQDGCKEVMRLRFQALLPPGFQA